MTASPGTIRVEVAGANRFRNVKPPICELCGNRFSSADGGLVTFVGDERSTEWHRRAREERLVGHPPDQGWFCGEHVEAARKLSGGATLTGALGSLRKSLADGLEQSQQDPLAPSSAQANDRSEAAAPVVPLVDVGVDVVSTLAPAVGNSVPVSQFRQDVDGRRDFPIAASSITRVRRLVDDAFEAMLSVLVELDSSLDVLPPMSLSTEVEVLESPEWRERGPAADEVTETRTTDAAGWILQRRHRHLDWRYGGQGRASESISLSPIRRASTFDRWMLFMAAMPIGDKVTEVSITGDVPDFLKPVVDNLIAMLEAPDDTEA